MMLAKALQSASASAPKVYVEDVFSTWLYTGNGSTQTITNGIDLAGEGGLVWVKGRSGATGHRLVDTSRGAQNSLQTNSTAAQVYERDGISDLGSSGFSLGTFLGSDTNYNASGSTYASWTFRKAAKFFDVVTYTGTGSNRTVTHNLGSAPGCMIIKRTDSASDWIVYHREMNNVNPASYYAVLNSTAARQSADIFQDLHPTSAHFTLNGWADINASGGTYVAYLFAHDAGGFGDSGNDSVIKCGTVNIGGSGTFDVNLGWEPQWVLFKYAGGGAGLTPNWYMSDNMRGFNMSAFTYLWPNTSAAEVTLSGEGRFVPYATGFKSTSSSFNAGDYIYIAIRRGPMKTPTDATEVFYQVTRSGTSAAASISGFGFPPDYFMSRARNNIADQTFQVFDRLRGPLLELSTISTGAEASYTGSVTSFNQDGVSFGTDNSAGGVNYTGGSYIYHSFRRAPGFFDVVAYTGTGSTLNVNHNLGVAPELIITKNRSSGITNWAAYSAALGNTQGLYPNAPNATSTLGWWNNTSPTSTVFTVFGTDITVNQSGSGHIAYLFATCPGVSKVGSYTGTGTTLSVDCGFTAGARFVLIKRTDSTGDWYVWDTARGIVSGNDPYLLLNSTAAEVTSTDYIDPLSSGFQISSTAPAAINASGGSYIFLAIA